MHLFRALYSKRAGKRRVRIFGKAAIEDLEWLVVFLPLWNGQTDAFKKREPLELRLAASDASGTVGLGAFWDGDYYAFTFEELEWRTEDIAVAELAAFLGALICWCRAWAGHRVVFHVDNQAVVSWLNKGRAAGEKAGPAAHHLMRTVTMILACYQISTEVRYITTTDNVLADALSRQDWSRFTQTRNAQGFPRRRVARGSWVSVRDQPSVEGLPVKAREEVERILAVTENENFSVASLKPFLPE